MADIGAELETHRLIIDGEVVALMQSDPSSSPEWETLLTTPYAVGNRGRKELIEALAVFGQTPEDGEQLIKADPGGRTINTLTNGYVEAVTGFPVGRPPTSTGRSKGTSDT